MRVFVRCNTNKKLRVVSWSTSQNTRRKWRFNLCTHCDGLKRVHQMNYFSIAHLSNIVPFLEILTHFLFIRNHYYYVDLARNPWFLRFWLFVDRKVDKCLLISIENVKRKISMFFFTMCEFLIKKRVIVSLSPLFASDVEI